MIHNDLSLSPAQVAFLTRSIAGFHELDWTISVAGQAGSDRRFVRVKQTGTDISYVLIVWDSSDKDWDRFLGIQQEVSGMVDCLPVVYAVDPRHGLILEEDLGTETLHSFCADNSEDPSRIVEAYRRVIDELVTWQRIPLHQSEHLAARSMDLEMFLWESDYFAQHCVTEFFGKESLLDASWQNERRTLALELSGAPHVCIHRDFQSENIMMPADKVRFVDFQGARLGPAGYDLASLLYDPYIDMLDSSIRTQLGYYYNEKMPGMLDHCWFTKAAVSRLMQALGAYGNLSLHKAKTRYRSYIPVALERLYTLVSESGAFPELTRITGECLEKT